MKGFTICTDDYEWRLLAEGCCERLVSLGGIEHMDVLVAPSKSACHQWKIEHLLSYRGPVCFSDADWYLWRGWEVPTQQGAFLCAPVCSYDDPYYHGKGFDRSLQFCSCFLSLDCGNPDVRSALELALRLQREHHGSLPIMADERYLNVGAQRCGVSIEILDNRWNWGKKPTSETYALHAAEKVNKLAWLRQFEFQGTPERLRG